MSYEWELITSSTRKDWCKVITTIPDGPNGQVPMVTEIEFKRINGNWITMAVAGNGVRDREHITAEALAAVAEHFKEQP